jgi:hypothetical protein
MSAIRNSSFCAVIDLRAPVDPVGIALRKITIRIVVDDDTVKHDVVWAAFLIRIIGEKYKAMTDRRLKGQTQFG